jgi:hypothetical protein
VVPRSNIDPVYLKDIPNMMPWLTPLDQSWWSNFLTNPKEPDQFLFSLCDSSCVWPNFQPSTDLEMDASANSTENETPISVSMDSFSMDRLPTELASVPSKVSIGMLALVRPSVACQKRGERFWLCIIREYNEHENEYTVQYYRYNTSDRKWKIMRGSGAYGHASQDSILLAGFELSHASTLKKHTLQQLESILKR